MWDPGEAVKVAKCALIVATPQGKIRWADTQAKLWLKTFLGRPKRAGRLPGKLCRWLSEIDTADAQELLVVRCAGQVLLVRAHRPHPTGAVALLLKIRTPESVPNRNHPALTPRENEVLRWLAAAKSDGEIGQILHISRSTVSKHSEHLFSKLGVENRTAAASLYPTQGDDENPAARPRLAA